MFPLNYKLLRFPISSKSKARNRWTDRQTDRQTDGVQQLMRPPREGNVSSFVAMLQTDFLRFLYIYIFHSKRSFISRMLYILTCTNIDADTVIYVVSVIVYFRFYFASFYCMFVSSVTPLRITVMINKSTFLYRCAGAAPP